MWRFGSSLYILSDLEDISVIRVNVSHGLPNQIITLYIGFVYLPIKDTFGNRSRFAM